MKKLLCLLLSTMIVVTCMGTVTVGAAGSGIYADDPIVIETGEASSYGFTTWANYAYTCQYDRMAITDIVTGENVATWIASKAITGLNDNYMRPKRVVVTNDYIVVLTGNDYISKFLVVYENPGVYTDTPPRKIGTFGFFDSGAPSLFVKGDNIYIVDRKLTAAEPMVMGKCDLFKGDIIAWRINIPMMEENGNVTNSNTYGEYIDIINQDLYDMGAVDFNVIGNHDYLWNTYTHDDEYMYVGVYNDKTAIPSETLMVKKIAFEDLTYNEEETGIILTDYNVGMGITYTTADRTMTHKQLREALKALPVYEVGVENEENPLLGDFEESLTVEILDTEDAAQNENYTVKIIITNLGDIVEKVKFDESRGAVTTDSLTTTSVNDQRVIGFTNEAGTSLQFKYVQPANSYQDGAIGIVGDYIYVFAYGDSKSYAGNRLYICDYKDGKIAPINDLAINSAGEGSNVLTAVGAGDFVFGTVQQTGTKVWFLNVDSAPDISMSWPEKVNTNQNRNPVGNGYRNIIHHGSRVYYMTADSANAAIIRVNVPEEIDLSIESKDSFEETGAYLHGFANGDEVTVNIDGVTRKVAACGGVWALEVNNIKNGTHAVTVTEGGEEVSAEFTTYSTAMEAKETEIAAAIEGCADGAALAEYFGSNPDAAELIGLDTAGNYSLLDAKAQEAVMDEVLPLLVSGGGATEKFNEEVSKAYKAKREADALKAVNDAVDAEDKDALKGAFAEYEKEIFADNNELLKKYNNNKSKWSKICNNFIGYGECDTLGDIAGNLEDAIKKANKKEESGNDDTVSSISGNRGNNTTYKVPQNPVEPAKPVETKKFSDVAENYWAYEPITSLATRGIINGVGEGSFAPEETVTREAFVKMLVEALALKGKGEGMTFSDVDTNAWYTDYVYIASSIGLVNGYDGKFGIGEGLTREQMATMLYRAAEIANINLEAKNDAKDFSDNAEIGDYAVEAVKALSEAGIINGMDNGTYAPKTVCNRAMAAKVIYEILAIK